MQLLNKLIILFDIDYTIFDTALFKQSNLTRYSIYPEVHDILDHLSNKATLGILSEGEKKLQQNKLIKTKIDHFFQKEHIHIASDKEKLIHTISEIYKDKSLIIVDDKLPLLLFIKKHIPNAFTVWIKRGEYAENQDPIPGFTPDAALDSITELSLMSFPRPCLPAGERRESSSIKNSFLILIRGLPGTGKTTIAQDIKTILADKVVILDPDDVDLKSKDFLDLSNDLQGKVDEKIIPYRYLLKKATEALRENKIVIWCQAWTKLWGMNSCLRSLKEKNPKLKSAVVEIGLPLNAIQERIDHRVSKGGNGLSRRTLEDFLSAFEKWDNAKFEEVTYLKVDGLKPYTTLAKEIVEKIIR